MDPSTRAGFQLFYKIQMFSFWSSLCYFLNKQILISEIRPVLYTNKMGLCVFILRSETTHLMATYDIYIAPGTMGMGRGGLRAETKAQATQSMTADPALSCKRDQTLHPQKRACEWYLFSVNAYRCHSNITNSKIQI